MPKSIFGIDWDNPDAVNEEGTKWWHLEEETRKLSKEDGVGKPVNDCKVWAIETIGDGRHYIITCEDRIIYGTQQYEALCIQIDVIRFVEE